MSLTLTVGYVSGIIAAAILVLQFLLPNAIILILVGFLKDGHTAVTWSVVEHSLLSSTWPLFLRADSTASAGVERSVKIVTWMRPLALGLITIAAIVTPLGLYDAVVPSHEPQYVKMLYVADPGPMGFGTPPRSELGFTRSCGDFEPMQCPGTTTQIDYTLNGSYIVAANITNGDYDMRIPKVLAELYQSGLADHPKSVSSFFDIQARQYAYSRNDDVNGGQRYIIDSFRYLSTVLLNDAVEPVEGLIVDTVSGGVGFRNHTVPTEATWGADWSEDILWIEPETQCINTNLSVKFQIPYYKAFLDSALVNISLVDEGGFANLVTKYPELDLSEAQRDPQLRNRAYKAAWMTAAYTMLIMNLTRPAPHAFSYLNSKVGNEYPINTYQSPYIGVNGIAITSLWQAILEPSTYTPNDTLAENPATNYTNPFGISASNFSDISLICSGAGGLDLANSSNIHVECGLVFGAATRMDGSKSLILEPGKWFTQPIYSCASALKASLKTVRFRYNGTVTGGNTLKALSVVSVDPKTYPANDSDTLPLWGIETVDFALHDLTQLWGLISPSQQHAVNLTTIRAPQLHLPGFLGSALTLGTSGYQFMPGTTGPGQALIGAYDNTGLGGSSSADYSGATNMAMLAKWKEYSVNESGVQRIINLIWTDIAANFLCGTRSWNTKSDVPPNLQKRDDANQDDSGEGVSSTSSSDGSALVPVTLYSRRIKYRWLFAIPAFVTLALAVAVLLATLVLTVLGRGTPSRLKFFLFHLSAGRLLGEMHYPGECDRSASTEEWIDRVGRRRCDLRAGAGEGGGYGTKAKPFDTSVESDQNSNNNNDDGIGQDRRGAAETQKGYMRVEASDRQHDQQQYYLPRLGEAR